MAHLISRRALVVLSVVGSALAASAACGQISTALIQGMNVAGHGNVTRIDNLAINNAGIWIVEADTDGDVLTDVVLIRSGLLYLHEGQLLSAPVGASISSFDDVNINRAGDSGWNIFLDGTSGGNDDSGIFFNDHLVFQEGTVSGSSSFSPNTPYIGFFGASINDSNQIFIMASIDDPAITSTVDRAIVVVTYNPVSGTYSETVLAKEGDILSGQTQPVADFGTGPHESDFNNLGQVLYVADLAGDTTVDTAIYLGSTRLAQEGSPSPVAGRNYASLLGRGMALNSQAEHAFKAQLSGDAASDLIIIKNGAKFVQEGDVLPAFAPFALETIGLASGPVGLSDAGEVLWYGDWNDPATAQDAGLFIGNELLVQEGVTTIDGMVVQSIANGQDAFAISPNGRYVIFEATLSSGAATLNGAFIFDRGPQCLADWNNDSQVNSQDYFDFVTDFFVGTADFNDDGITNSQDFFDFIVAFFAGC